MNRRHHSSSDTEAEPLTEGPAQRRLRMETDATHVRTFTRLFTTTQMIGIFVICLMGVWLNMFRGGFAWHSSPQREFNWHPLLMTIALVFLYGNGALIYRAFRSEPKRKLKLFHAFLMIMVFILTVVGLKAVFDSHNLNIVDGVSKPIPNIYSLHSWLGICIVFLFACQWLCGLLTFLFPGFRISLRSAYLPVHQFFGILIFVGAVCTALIGLNEKAFFVLSNGKYSELPPEGVLINCIGILLVIFAAFVVYLTANQNYRRRATEDEVLLTDTVME